MPTVVCSVFVYYFILLYNLLLMWCVIHVTAIIVIIVLEMYCYLSVFLNHHFGGSKLTQFWLTLNLSHKF